MNDPAYYAVADGDGQTMAAQQAGGHLPRSASHPFYTRLNQILDTHVSTDTSKGSASGFTRIRLANCC